SPSQTYTLSLHDALPICFRQSTINTKRATPITVFLAIGHHCWVFIKAVNHRLKECLRIRNAAQLGSHLAFLVQTKTELCHGSGRSEEHTSELQSRENLVC